MSAPPKFQPASKPRNENQRLAALQRYRLLDTAPEASFDRITSLASRLLEVPIALVTLIDAERQWFKSCVGIPLGETSRDTSFCAHAVLMASPFVVEDATLDARFAGNPFVLGPPYVRFYAGAQLTTPDGYALGTLCVIDTKPRRIGQREIDVLSDLARLVVDLIEARLAYHGRHLFEQVAELSPHLIYVFDLETRNNVYGNRELWRVLGNAGETAGSQLLETVIHPDDMPNIVAHMAAWRDLAEGERHELVYRVRNDAGDYRWFHTHETVFERDADGQPKQILGIASDVTSLKQAEQRLSELATTDDLTGLPNARALRQRLAQLVSEGERGRKFAVVVADIDHFKKVNDGHGHKMGDEVLAAIARTLRQSVRGVDFVARYGGEEFVILLSDVDEELACMLAEAMRRAVAAVERPLRVTCSFGVCASTSHVGSDADALVRAADAALYRAKSDGRDRVVGYGEIARVAADSSLRSSLDERKAERRAPDPRSARR